MSIAAVRADQENLLRSWRTKASWWSWPVLVFVVTRAVDALMILRAATHQIALHGLLRWRARGRPDRPSLLPVVGGIALIALWPATWAVATGRLTAFTDTQRGWRRSASTGPFGLFSVAAELRGPLAVGCLTIALAAVLWLVLRSGGPAWGPEVRAWAAGYRTH